MGLEPPSILGLLLTPFFSHPWEFEPRCSNSQRLPFYVNQSVSLVLS